MSKDTIYTAEYTFWSRGSIRGGMSWSTKRCKQVLLNMGFDTEAAYEGQPSNALIQRVQFSGTRDQVIEQRHLIADRLRTLSGGRMAMRFKLHR